MVTFDVTARVRSHRYNQKYLCLLIHFDAKEDDMRNGGTIEFVDVLPWRFNWMLTDEHAKEITKRMVERSPSYRVWLREWWENYGAKNVAEFV